MNIESFSNKPDIDGALLIEENIFQDLRGSFNRIFDDRNYNAIFFDGVKNINLSKNNKKGTVRGLHMQKGLYAETKIIYCNKGSIIDLFIDCRKESSTFGKINKIFLGQEKVNTLLIPRGCLHSFLTLQDNTEVMYITDNYYSPENEVSVSPLSDQIIKEFEPNEIKVCSEKDKNSVDLKSFFDELNF